MQKLKLNQCLLDAGVKVAELSIPTEDCQIEHYFEEQVLFLSFDSDYCGQTYLAELEIPFQGRMREAYKYAKQIRGSSCAVIPTGPRVGEMPTRWNYCLQVCPVTLPLFERFS